MNPISNTAFYCCGIRMEDAKRTHSVCNDHYAERYMDARGRAIFEPFKAEKRANCSNIARCRIIDDHIKTELDELRLPRPVAWLMLNWQKRDLGGNAVHKFAFKNECL